MLPATLDAIQALLEDEGFTCERLPAGQGAVHDRFIAMRETLEVELDRDLKGRATHLFLYFSNKETQLTQDRHSKIRSEPFLELFLPFPFHMHEEAAGDLARYLLLINRNLEFPGFGLSEQDRLCYYRTVLFFPAHRVSNTLFLDLIGSVMLARDVFGPHIESIALGEKTFSQAIATQLV